MSYIKRSHLIYGLLATSILTACGGGSNEEASTPISTTEKDTGNLSLTINNPLIEAESRSPISRYSLGVNRFSMTNTNELQQVRSNKNLAKSSAKTSNLARKGLTPNIDFSVDSYQIKGTGPANQSFDLQLSNNSNHQLDFLRFGSWSIELDANNSEGLLFAQGTTDVNINVGETTQAQIDLQLVDGIGSLDLAIEWPTNQVQNPEITGILISDTQPDITIAFTPGEDKSGFTTYVAELDDSVASGYYTLVVKVIDKGLSGSENHLAMGIAETARILAGQTTSGSYSLEGVAGTGSIGLDVTLDLNELLPISIIGTETYPTAFDFDSSTVFTVNSELAAGDEDAGNITQLWYLNGQLVTLDNDNEMSYQIDSDRSPFSTSINGKLMPGHYRLDVVAFNIDGSRSGSDTFQFEVTGNPVGIKESAQLTSRVGFMQSTTTGTRFSPLSNAQINLSGQPVIVDANGNFSVEDVSVGTHTLNINADGYFPYSRRIDFAKDENKAIEKIVLTAGETSNFNSNVESTVSLSEGLASVKFPENALQNSNGDSYEGVVTVKHTALNPLSPNFLEVFPGEFKGQVEGEETLVDILSFGVLAVELEDDAGNPLTIQDGKSAEIRMQVTNPETAPESIDLWHLDENTGTWVQEGQATLVGDEYVGSVGHFSWWNFDYRLDGERAGYRWLNIQVKDSLGTVVPNASVTMTSRAGFAYEKTYTTNVNGKTGVRALFTETSTQTPDSLFYDVEAKYLEHSSGVQTLRFFPDAMGAAIGDDAEQQSAAQTITLTLTTVLPTFKGEVDLTTERRPLVNRGSALIYNNQVRLTEDEEPRMTFTIENGGNGELDITGVSISPSDHYRLQNNRRDIYPLTLDQDNSLTFGITYTGAYSGFAANDFHRATLTISNNSLTPTIEIPLMAIEQLNGFYEESTSSLRTNNYTGSIAFGTNVDPYSDNDFLIDQSLSNYAYLSEQAGSQRRVLSGFDLTALPQNALITSAKIKSTSNSRFSDPIRLLRANQGATLINTDFTPICSESEANCLLGSAPVNNNWGEQSIELNASGLEYLTGILNDADEDNTAKFLIKSTGTTWSYLFFPNLYLEVTYAQ